jgi:hypothetical protein
MSAIDYTESIHDDDLENSKAIKQFKQEQILQPT